jgi:hypothetical protein
MQPQAHTLEQRTHSLYESTDRLAETTAAIRSELGRFGPEHFFSGLCHNEPAASDHTMAFARTLSVLRGNEQTDALFHAFVLRQIEVMYRLVSRIDHRLERIDDELVFIHDELETASEARRTIEDPNRDFPQFQIAPAVPSEQKAEPSSNSILARTRPQSHGGDPSHFQPSSAPNRRGARAEEKMRVAPTIGPM